MAPTTEVTVTIPTLEGIAAVLAVAYYATVVAHPYIVGFALMLWSYHPEKPIQAIRYTAWTLPKHCIATARGWVRSKSEPEVYRPFEGFTTPNPYGYTPTMGLGIGCQLGCCNPSPYYTGTRPYSRPYTSFYPSPLPSYGSVQPFVSKAYELEEEEGGSGVLWKAFGWGLWICGLAVMLTHGPSVV